MKYIDFNNIKYMTPIQIPEEENDCHYFYNHITLQQVMESVVIVNC